MWSPAEEGVRAITAFYEKARTWWIGSDPGLLRLRMATRTTAALACSLVMLYLLTRATGQPLTVALLGVVSTITGIAARTVIYTDHTRCARDTAAAVTALTPSPAITSTAGRTVGGRAASPTLAASTFVDPPQRVPTGSPTSTAANF